MTVGAAPGQFTITSIVQGTTGRLKGTYKFTTGAATFGVVAPMGAAPDSIQVGSLATQVDVKNRWPDKSIKLAVVSTIIPSAGDYQVVAAASTSGTPLTPKWPTASVTYVVKSGEVTGTYVATLPAFNGTDSWLSGPIVRDARVVIFPRRMSDNVVHPYLRVVYDIRCFSIGACKVDVSPHNTLHSAGNRITGDITVVVNGATVFTESNYPHYYLTRWRRSFWTTGSTVSIVHPDWKSFVEAKAIPDWQDDVFDLKDQDLKSYYPNPSTGGASGNRWDIGGIGASIAAGWDTPGGRDELGPYPDWWARYVIWGGDNRREFILAHEDQNGSWNIYLTDDTLTALRHDTSPGTVYYWLDTPSGRQEPPHEPMGNQADAYGVYLTDNAHFPSMGYMPYLLTGDRWYCDQLRFAASNAMMKYYPGDRFYPRQDNVTNTWMSDGASGKTALMVASELRGSAWSLRNMTDAASYLPDADPFKAYAIEVMKQNLELYDLEATLEGRRWSTPEPHYGLWVGKGYTPDPAYDWVVSVPWQLCMTLWVVDHAIDQQLWGERGKGYRQRAAKHITELFLHEADGLTRMAAGASVLSWGRWATPKDPNSFGVNWYKTWAEIVPESLEITNNSFPPYTNYHGIEIRLALMAGEGLGDANATKWYDWMMTSEVPEETEGMWWYIRDRAGWAIQRGTMGLSTSLVKTFPKKK